MATYREIKGTDVAYESSAPGSPTDAGHVWFNSTDGIFQSYLAAGAWATTSPMVVAEERRNYGANGTQSAFWITNTGPASLNTQEYNGTGWSAGGDIGTSRPTQNGGFGTLTAGANFGGHPALTSGDLYDGTTWTASPAALTNGRWDSTACGTQTAGLMIGGAAPPVVTTAVEEFSGTAWTAGTVTPSPGLQEATCAGIQTAAVWMGGSQDSQPTAVATTFNYDGSTWTASGALPAAVRHALGFGTQAAAVNVGGYQPSASTVTNLYDGSAWSTGAAYPVAQTMFGGGAGSGTAGTAAGGEKPSISSLSCEYDFSISTTTAGAWATGGVYPAPRSQTGTGTLGTKAATMAFGGAHPLTTSAEYDGSSWTATPALTVAKYWSAQAGTTAAAAAFGGVGTPGNGTLYSSATEEWDGSSWSIAPGAMPATKIEAGGAGTQTAALSITGLADPYTMSNTCFEYDGTSWTNGGSTTYYRYVVAGAGTQTAAMQMGGYNNPGPGPYGPAPFSPDANARTCEFYNGTAWTNGASLLQVQSGSSGGAGTQSDAMIVAGGISGTPASTVVQRYDGTAFSTSPAVSTGRFNAGGSGTTASAAYVVGGNTPGLTDATEEFSDASTSVDAKSITTS